MSGEFPTLDARHGRLDPPWVGSGQANATEAGAAPPEDQGRPTNQTVAWRHATRQLEAIAPPLAVLVARAEALQGKLDRGELDGIPSELVALRASAERLAAQVQEARDVLVAYLAPPSSSHRKHAAVRSARSPA
jgi:hypothetical protein